ncbi:carbohydrate ABC transporter permease [Microbacterium immunditiarum]|uniref:Raffinose/stachyose/melibiose transport system permease protein n=1 Tax=Microbacterium immunditiarum TaxID=337480 RepID=A0A7Y9GRT5_9MICO|nr:carbohydrate ABC transporter permease [Microbacterium immunditiarum]NYE21436.1 raffinose/stachyose/melibiose transport system permease protein [Microbacterium immunditiarum]
MTAALQHRAGKRGIDWSQPIVYVVALVVAAIAIGPVLYVAIAGFRTNPDFFADPAGLPNPWVFDNYARILGDPRFWNQVLASTVTALGTTLGVMLLGVMAAFVIARYDFRGRNFLYALFTTGLLFPLTISILPLTVLLRQLNLFGSWWGLIIPQVAFALPTTIIILVPFLRAIPGELEDAAVVDGTTRIGFFWRIMLPLSMPGLMTVGVLAFVGSWNAYLLPLFVLQAGGARPEDYTLPLGVQFFSTAYGQDTTGVLAYTSLAMLPAILFFTLAEKRIVGGLQGAVKG